MGIERILAALLCCAVLAFAQEPAEPTPPERPNVLFLCVDDLAPVLGVDGMAGAQTPHLDRLAQAGTRFTRHYAVMPTCGASRYAMWMGVQPTRPAHFGNNAFATLRQAQTESTHPSLPELFGKEGYRTIGLGKVSHEPGGVLPDGSVEFPRAFSELPTTPGPWGANAHLLHGYADGVTRTARRRSEGVLTPLFEFPDAKASSFPDARLADEAIATLDQLSQNATPFFLAVGFYKPHLPFVAPRADWDAIDPDAVSDAEPLGLPADEQQGHGFVQSGEVTGNYACSAWSDRTWDRAERLAMRRAYLAATRFVDAQIGRVLDRLDHLGLSESTIVVVWGDHGWHLGHQGLFGKHTPYEAALRSVLLMRVPGKPKAITTDAIVSSHDLYPTLCRLAAIEPPPELAGRDISPLLSREELPLRPAESWWQQGGLQVHSTRTTDRRIVEWRDAKTKVLDHRHEYELDAAGYEIRLVASTR